MKFTPFLSTLAVLSASVNAVEISAAMEEQVETEAERFSYTRSMGNARFHKRVNLNLPKQEDTKLIVARVKRGIKGAVNQLNQVLPDLDKIGKDQAQQVTFCQNSHYWLTYIALQSGSKAWASGKKRGMKCKTVALPSDITEVRAWHGYYFDRFSLKDSKGRWTDIGVKGPRDRRSPTST